MVTGRRDCISPTRAGKRTDSRPHRMAAQIQRSYRCAGDRRCSARPRDLQCRSSGRKRAYPHPREMNSTSLVKGAHIVT